MVAGVSFEYAVSRFRHRRKATARQILNVLAGLDVEVRSHRFKRPRRWRRDSQFQSDSTVILKLKWRFRSVYHWVVYARGMIYDPAGKTYHISELSTDMCTVSYLPVC